MIKIKEKLRGPVRKGSIDFQLQTVASGLDRLGPEIQALGVPALLYIYSVVRKVIRSVQDKRTEGVDVKGLSPSELGIYTFGSKVLVGLTPTVPPVEKEGEDPRFILSIQTPDHGFSIWSTEDKHFLYRDDKEIFSEEGEASGYVLGELVKVLASDLFADTQREARVQDQVLEVALSSLKERFEGLPEEDFVIALEEALTHEVVKPEEQIYLTY